MTDAKYVFEQDVRDRKRTGRNAKYMNRTGKGNVRMPSDNLSRKEKAKLNGPVNTYDMGKPMTYDRFKAMPEDLQRGYLQGIVDKFHAPTRVIAQLWGIGHSTVGLRLRELGVKPAGGRGKRTDFDEAAWDAWVADGVIPEDAAPTPEVEYTSVTRNTTKREEILRTAEKCVMGDRQQDYGSPENNFAVIAEMWNAYIFSHPLVYKSKLSPADVAAMLALVKIARIASGHAKADNWVDLAGYAACGGELEAREERAG